MYLDEHLESCAVYFAHGDGRVTSAVRSLIGFEEAIGPGSHRIDHGPLDARLTLGIITPPEVDDHVSDKIHEEHMQHAAGLAELPDMPCSPCSWCLLKLKRI